MSEPKLSLEFTSNQLVAIRSSARATIDRNAEAIERYKGRSGVDGILQALADESADLLQVIRMKDQLAFKN